MWLLFFTNTFTFNELSMDTLRLSGVIQPTNCNVTTNNAYSMICGTVAKPCRRKRQTMWYRKRIMKNRGRFNFGIPVLLLPWASIYGVQYRRVRCCRRKIWEYGWNCSDHQDSREDGLRELQTMKSVQQMKREQEKILQSFNTPSYRLLVGSVVSMSNLARNLGHKVCCFLKMLQVHLDPFLLLRQLSTESITYSLTLQLSWQVMNYVWSFRRKSTPRAQEEKPTVDVSEIQEKLEFVMVRLSVDING